MPTSITIETQVWGKGRHVGGLIHLKAHTRLVMNDREDLIVACAIGDLGWLKRCLKDGFRPAQTNSDVSRIVDRQQLTEKYIVLLYKCTCCCFF